MWRINCTREDKVDSVDAKSDSTDVKEANATANWDANGGEREGRTHNPHLIYAHGMEDSFELRVRSRSKRKRL